MFSGLTQSLLTCSIGDMRIGVFVMLSMVIGGCNTVPDGPVGPGGAGPLDDADGVTPAVFSIEMRIISVEVPVGVASGSEKLWSYLDEERAKAVRDATMAQNGIRLGVAPADTWEDLVKVLQEMTGIKLGETRKLTWPGHPLFIPLKTNQDRQTIFTKRRNLTHSTRDYPPGDNVLLINCSLNELDYNKLIIAGVPQIRSTTKVPDIQNAGAGATITYEPELFTLDACTFQVMLTSGDILVLGPGVESRMPYSVGRQFLVNQKDGLECETLLVIMPTARKMARKANTPPR